MFKAIKEFFQSCINLLGLFNKSVTVADKGIGLLDKAVTMASDEFDSFGKINTIERGAREALAQFHADNLVAEAQRVIAQS